MEHLVLSHTTVNGQKQYYTSTADISTIRETCKECGSWDSIILSYEEGNKDNALKEYFSKIYTNNIEILRCTDAGLTRKDLVTISISHYGTQERFIDDLYNSRVITKADKEKYLEINKETRNKDIEGIRKNLRFSSIDDEASEDGIIFGEQYDLALGCILRTKSNYSKKAIKFIKELPLELVNNIRTVYREGLEVNYGIYDMTNTEKRPIEFFEVLNEDNPYIRYKFYIMCRELYIVKSEMLGNISIDMMSLALHPIDENVVKGMTDSAEFILGSICTGDYPRMNFTEVDYSLKKTKSGYKVNRSYSLIGNMLELKSIHPINIKETPEELKERANKLVLK